ncbi:hypothetical protein QYE76_034614 [Lolium multiflorum]|uniref:CCHC-type domain-containing protein n=1 Tax=Lolium multiflorum TaxID=4521 RepID=A0AAD8VMP7_LOLMU|nr:hypothetical protein QYE76_034614 [Lolium multiflorum]
MFSKTEEPLDADDWLQTIENILEVAGVEAAEKVLFATHYLSGPARAWWTSARAMNAGQMMTWEDFKLKFSKYHVPQGLIKKMRDEFRELKQGRMSVVEYRDSFSLSRYAPDETDTNEKRKERFRMHDEMQTVNNNGGPPKPGGNNNNNHNHNSHNNNGNNSNTNTGPRTGSNAIPVTPKDKSTVNCYECGVVGHYSKECPKKLAKIATNTAALLKEYRFAVEGTKITTTPFLPHDGHWSSEAPHPDNGGMLTFATMPYPCRPSLAILSLVSLSQHNLAQKHLLITTTLPVPSWSSPTHGIGQASRAQTRQKRARHAVSAPRRRPGRARARHRTAASALPYLSISASRTLTPPATHQTSSLACGGPVDVAMIKVLPPRYCTHLIDASTPPSSLCCLFTRASSV